MEIEKKVYSSWAFSDNECKRREINYEIYQEIKNDAEVKCINHRRGSNVYKILSNPKGLDNDKLALICDSGNLCFGYTVQNGNIIIFTD